MAGLEWKLGSSPHFPAWGRLEWQLHRQEGVWLSLYRSSLQTVLPHTVALMTNLSLPLDPGLRALLSHLILEVLQTGSL